MKKLFKQIRSYFNHETLIYAAKLQPGKLIGMYKKRNEKFAKIAFTNRIKIKGYTPMTMVNIKDIWCIKRLPSQFQKHFFGKKAKTKSFIIKK